MYIHTAEGWKPLVPHINEPLKLVPPSHKGDFSGLSRKIPAALEARIKGIHDEHVARIVASGGGWRY